jgi:hypothetical protein
VSGYSVLDKNKSEGIMDEHRIYNANSKQLSDIMISLHVTFIMTSILLLAEIPGVARDSR